MLPQDKIVGLIEKLQNIKPRNGVQEFFREHQLILGVHLECAMSLLNTLDAVDEYPLQEKEKLVAAIDRMEQSINYLLNVKC